MELFFLNPFTPERYSESERNRYNVTILQDGNRLKPLVLSVEEWESYKSTVSDIAELKATAEAAATEAAATEAAATEAAATEAAATEAAATEAAKSDKSNKSDKKSGK